MTSEETGATTGTDEKGYDINLARRAAPEQGAATPRRPAMTEFVVSCRADLGQPVIDELHARGAYLAHGGEAGRGDGPGLPLHRLMVEAASRSEAIVVARDLAETTGARCQQFEVE